MATDPRHCTTKCRLLDNPTHILDAKAFTVHGVMTAHCIVDCADKADVLHQIAMLLNCPNRSRDVVRLSFSVALPAGLGE